MCPRNMSHLLATPVPAGNASYCWQSCCDVSEISHVAEEYHVAEVCVVGQELNDAVEGR